MAPPELHWQSFASPEADGALSGEIRHPEGSLPPLGMSARRIIACRAMLAIEKPQAIINLGVGMPEVLPAAAGSSRCCSTCMFWAGSAVQLMLGGMQGHWQASCLAGPCLLQLVTVRHGVPEAVQRRVLVPVVCLVWGLSWQRPMRDLCRVWRLWWLPMLPRTSPICCP